MMGRRKSVIGKRRQGFAGFAVLGAGVFAILAVVFLQATSAAVFAVNGEAEAGVIAGNAVVVSDGSASGGSSVKFAGSSTAALNRERLGISTGFPTSILSSGISYDTYFAKAANIGFGWARFDCSVGDPSFCDQFFNYARTNNMRVLAIFNQGTPQQNAATAKHLHDAYPQTLGAIEILNEWDMTANMNGAQYAAYLKPVYTAIKAVTPDVPVMVGGLSGNQGTGQKDQTLAQVYTALGGSSAGAFDAVAMHPYDPGSTTTNPASGNYRQMVRMRKVMDAHGDQSKQLWASESNVSSCIQWQGLLTEDQKATRFQADMRDYFHGIHNANGDTTGYNDNGAGDMNPGPFFLYRLYKNGGTDEQALGLVYTSGQCGRPDGYEPPVVQAIRSWAAERQ